MKKNTILKQISIPFIVLLLLLPGGVEAGPFLSPEERAVNQVVAQGYTCEAMGNQSGGWITNWTQCTKVIPPYYSGQLLSNFKVKGLYNVNQTDTVIVNYHKFWGGLTPFVYLYNAPDGEVAVTLDSTLDRFTAEPSFTRSAGWDVSIINGELLVENQRVDHLYYELELPRIELTRNGRNFDSRKALVSYLNESDFLTRLGLSEIEKANSLGYINEAVYAEPESNYYYLTVLDEETIRDTSSLQVIPAPETMVRQYFAVYPTRVPVTTSGDFVFPKTVEPSGFMVKETGEFLLNDKIFVTFK